MRRGNPKGLLRLAGMALLLSPLFGSAIPAAKATIDTDTYILVEGFDTCQNENLSPVQMQAWWSDSPFWIYGTYLGGSNGPSRHCVPKTTAFINAIIGQNWALEPFWYGRQMPASCIGTSFAYQISLNTTTADNQGVSEGNAAQAAAESYGYGTNDIIYYDLEAVGSTTSCKNAAKAFINGWEYSLNAQSEYWGGVYGSSCSSQLTSFSTIANVPYAIAPRDTSHSPTGVYGLSCLSDGLWNQDQRIHQLAAIVSLSYDGYPVIVDEDCADGPVDTNYGPVSSICAKYLQ
jgi:hypothetical protein